MFPFTITNNSVTVIVDGQTHTVHAGAPNFHALRGAVLSGDYNGIRGNLSAAKSVESWSNGRFIVKDGAISYEGSQLPKDLSDRIMSMAAAGESPDIFFRFWERLSHNPSKRSVEQLFTFLNNQRIPFTKDGNFLAYKSIRSNWFDHHSGTIKNEVGKTISMPRNQISDDPSHACHEGLHVGALEYANNFGGPDRKIVICEVDPKDVVCVPFDSSFQKMRVSSYTIIGMYGSPLSSTTYEREEVDVDDLDDEYWFDDDEIDEDPVDEKDKAPKAPVKVTDKSSDAQLDKATSEQLITLSLDRLRKYAARHLNILGASKIVGGKVVLIQKIEEARSK